MDGAESLAPGTAHRRVVRLADGTLLNRYWDDCDTPRDESHIMDVATAAASPRPAPEVYRNLRAGAERLGLQLALAGRWPQPAHDPHRETAAARPQQPPARPRIDPGARARGSGRRRRVRRVRARAARRAEAVRRLLWDDNGGVFTDHLFRGMASTGQVTLATVYPLYFGIADEARSKVGGARPARAPAAAPRSATTTVRSGSGWDLPDGWAPLRWLAIRGLER